MPNSNGPNSIGPNAIGPNAIGPNAIRSEWEIREIAPELRERYFAGGHWTDDTLTSHVVRGLAANPQLEFRVWSHTRPTTRAPRPDSAAWTWRSPGTRDPGRSSSRASGAR